MAAAAIKLGIAFNAPSELVKPKDNQILLSEEDPHRLRCLNDCGFALTKENFDKSDRQNIVDFLKKCTSLSQGKQIHAHALRVGLGKDTFVGNLLLGMYDKNNALEEARSVFDHMSHRNIVTWNSMIGAYSKRLLYLEACHVFHQMHEFAMDPDKVTFLSLLCACASPSALTQGNIIHAYIVGCECQSDVVLNNALVNMYGKCGSLHMARAVFNNMRQRSVVSWNSMIARYTDHGKGREALEVYKEMRQLGVQPCKNTFISVLSACAIVIFLSEGRAIHASIIECGFESDVIVGTALINFYGKCRCLLDARLVFEKVQEHDVALWTALISAHSQQGKDALQLYLEMQKQGMKLDQISLISVLGACEIPAALEEAEQAY